MRRGLVRSVYALMAASVVACSDSPSSSSSSSSTVVKPIVRSASEMCDHVVHDAKFNDQGEVVVATGALSDKGDDIGCTVSLAAGSNGLRRLGLAVDCTTGSVLVAIDVEESFWAVDRDETTALDNGGCRPRFITDDAVTTSTGIDHGGKRLLQCKSPGETPRDGATTVVIFMPCHTNLDQVVAVEREVLPGTPALEATIQQLLYGETPGESRLGLWSAFGAYTAHALRGVSVNNGVATFSLSSAFDTANNISTSYMSTVAWEQLTETLLQFSDIAGFEFEIDGERWCGWENTCNSLSVPLVTRP